MKIIDKAEKIVYIFNCPVCCTKLEADCNDLTVVGNKSCKYLCPICEKVRYIYWSALKCKIYYTDK